MDPPTDCPFHWLCATTRVLLRRIDALEKQLLVTGRSWLSVDAVPYFPKIPPGVHVLEALPRDLCSAVRDARDRAPRECCEDEKVRVRQNALEHDELLREPAPKFEFSELCARLHNLRLKTYMDEIHLFFSLIADDEDYFDNFDYSDDENAESSESDHGESESDSDSSDLDAAVSSSVSCKSKPLYADITFEYADLCASLLSLSFRKYSWDLRKCSFTPTVASHGYGFYNNEDDDDWIDLVWRVNETADTESYIALLRKQGRCDDDPDIAELKAHLATLTPNG